MITFEPGIDISNWTGSLTVDQVAIIERDFRFCIIGLQNSALARQQQSWLRGKVALEYYLDRPGRDLSIPEAGARCWIDIEPGCFISAADARAERSKLAARGLPAGVYGNQVSMGPVLVSSTEFADLPLWYANYHTSEPDWSTFQPFNGWKRPVIWQWSSGGWQGINCDLNIMEVETVPPVPLVEDDEMRHVTISAAERGPAPFRSYLIGATLASGFASRWVEGEIGHAAANRIAGKLIIIPLVELLEFKPSPDPLAP